MLKTIKISKNLFKMKLPQPTYDSIQFASLPNHNLLGGKSRNLNVHQTMSTTAAEKTTLPKISLTQSSRNHIGSLSTKSQGVKNISVDNEGDDG